MNAVAITTHDIAHSLTTRGQQTLLPFSNICQQAGISSLQVCEAATRASKYQSCHMADNPPPFGSLFLPTISEMDNSIEEDIPLSPNSPRRRRRVLRSNARSSTDIGANATGSPTSFNPEASEFVPTNRMPSKRKASSSARQSKTAPAMSRSTAPDRNPTENPIIHASELFGPGALAQPNSAGDLSVAALSNLFDGDATSDIFDLDDMDVTPPPAPTPAITITPTILSRQRQRMTDAMSVIRAQVTEKSKRAVDPIEGLSAILFSREGPPATNEVLDEHIKLRYLPLVSNSNARQSITKDTELVILPSHRDRISITTRGPKICRASWPADMLPVEIFDLITAFLSRDDVKSARLVNREWERKVSGNLFASSVVPFNTELYDMIEEDSKAAQSMTRTSSRIKGKGKARAVDVPHQGTEVSPRGLHWQNAKDDSEGKVYKGHGLRVFQGFGPYIRHFGMSFEVAEAQLARPPVKKELDHVTSYYGSYDWPQHQYTRFAGLAGLERTADETLRMKAAFANLGKVQDLGLSLDNGLGWLNGPDKSIYGRIFQRSSPVFGHSRPVPDQQFQDAQAFWQAIQECHAGFGNQREVSLARHILAKSPSEIPGLQSTKYANTKLWSSITSGRTAPAVSPGSTFNDGRHGVLYTTFSQTDSAITAFDKSALVPAELRKEQKEWLMETDWAQRAFLECYMLAVMDNPTIFERVKTLTIAKVSSGLLPILSRETFWDALPGVTDVTIHVKPDWKTVERDNAGFAETCPRQPSEAVNTFYRCILRDRLCLRSSITKLNIGWAAGGEHAEGIFARNNHILPAPITQLEYTTANSDQLGLVFRFVEHLTLHNCWMTPVTFEGLLKNHTSKALKTLVLDSVSLTAHPRFPAGGQAAMQNQILQALAAPPAVAGQGQGQPQGAGQQANLPQWLQNVGALPAGWQQALQNGALQGGPQAWQNQLAQLAQMAGVNQMPQQIPQQQAQNQMALLNFGLGNNAQQMVAAGMAGPNAVAPPQALPPHLQNLANLVPVVGNPNMQQNQPTPSHWTEGHREGSWAQVLDKMSPGSIFSDYLPQPQPWEEQLPERAETNLQSIEFKSCGYVKLTNNTAFDQYAIEAGAEQGYSVWFRTRQAALLPAMMSTNDRYLGRIVQFMPDRELNALRFAWGFNEGWTDREKAEEVEYDGLLAGGTGRFSGRIVKGEEARVPTTP